MDQQLVDDILTSDSDEVADLKANLDKLEGFIELIRDVNALPNVSTRFYEDSRSLYQTTAVGHDIVKLENLLAKFFGAAVKPADKALPRKLRKSSVVKFLGGIQKDQSLFTMDLKTGHFYGALWPWRRNKSKIEIHLGYCSDWMTDEDYLQLEDLVHQSVSHGAFEHMNANIGGQIHGISLPSFLQMAEMEKSSFTLRVTSRHRVGALHLSDGELLAAELDEHTGCDAAYRIISWDDASIDIEPLNETKPREINMPLMHVLMESLKLKDEAAPTREKPPPQPKGRSKKRGREPQAAPAKRLVRLQRAKAPEIRRARPRVMTMVGIGVGVFAVLAVIAVVTFHIMENRRASDDYTELMATINKTTSFEKQIDILNKYLEENPNTAYVATINARIREVRQGIEDQAFEQATLSVSGLVVDETYEAKAIEIYRQFLEKYPNSRHTEKINKSIAEIKNLLDQYYYEELKRAARLDFNKRLEAYRKYLGQFPDGTYQRDVEILINEMGEKYLEYLKDEAKECEAKRRWETCIEHCDNFIAAYSGLGLSEKAMELKSQMEDKRDYVRLQSNVEDAGTDYLKAYTLYEDHLRERPGTSQRKNIETEMARLSGLIKVQRKWVAVKNYAENPRKKLNSRIKAVDRYIRKNINGLYSSDAQSLLDRLQDERRTGARRQQIVAKQEAEQRRLQQQIEEQAQRKERVARVQAQLASRLRGSTRYRPNGDGTFTDLTSGLTWAIIDSYQELNGCMAYSEALKYVQTLRLGGHSAWRLPTAYELAAIIKKPPYFPSTGAKWYWSSETAVKGYHSVADVVTAEHQGVFQRNQRGLTECGSVRAILASP